MEEVPGTSKSAPSGDGIFSFGLGTYLAQSSRRRCSLLWVSSNSDVETRKGQHDRLLAQAKRLLSGYDLRAEQ
jgi:hypothetical protein